MYSAIGDAVTQLIVIVLTMMGLLFVLGWYLGDRYDLPTVVVEIDF